MKIVLIAVTSIGVAYSAFYAIDKAAAMPDVWFSYSTNECVKVINYTDEIFACESLPAKFNHVWVQ
jgi:hypothetical protein